MLDQNTDRMWFVIGAVIVGAAIIFIANGTLPTLFASVTDSFQEASYKGLDVVEEITERPANYEELFSKYAGQNLALGTAHSNITRAGQGSNGYYRVDDEALSELVGMEMTASFYIKSYDGDGGYFRHIMVTPNTRGVHLGQSSKTNYALTDEWERYTFTFRYSRKIHNLIINSDGIGSVGPKSNTFVKENNGERKSNIVRNYKLEVGTEATPHSVSPKDRVN